MHDTRYRKARRTIIGTWWRWETLCCIHEARRRKYKATKWLVVKCLHSVLRRNHVQLASHRWQDWLFWSCGVQNASAFPLLRKFACTPSAFEVPPQHGADIPLDNQSREVGYMEQYTTPIERILAEIPSHLAHDVWAVKFSFHVCSSTLLGWGYLHSICLNCRFAPPNPSDIMCRMLSYLAAISHATFESPVARHSDISNVSLSIQKLRNLIPKVEG